MPRKIRQLIADLEQAGFHLVDGGKGSHHKVEHDQLTRTIVLSGKSGADAKPYQEKLVKIGIQEAEDA